MKNIITILMMMVPVLASAQIVTTYDSRTNGQPVVSQYRAVDIGVIDPVRNPDFRDFNKLMNLRVPSAPSLINLDAKIAIPITGTFHNAKADLRRAIKEAKPKQSELQRMLGANRRDEKEAALKQAINDATNQNQLENAVIDYLKYHDRIIDALLEKGGFDFEPEANE